MRSLVKVSCVLFLMSLMGLLLNNCKSGGGGGSPTSPPYINAALISFPTGSAPDNLPNASVIVDDSSGGVNITNAMVVMNGVTLSYVAANNDYEGNVPVSPGESVQVQVAVNGNTYSASATQFASYPNILSPPPGSGCLTSSAIDVAWSGGTPTANARYAIGVLDAADINGALVWPADNFLQDVSINQTAWTIPTNSVTAGNRLVLVGIVQTVPIANASAHSVFNIGGFTYIPITVKTWPISTLDSAGWVGRMTSIARDPLDKIHIVYYDFSNTSLKYATNASGAWIASTIPGTIGSVSISTSMAIDSAGKIHIGYTNGILSYLTNTSGVWVTTPVDISGNVGFASTAIDSNNKVHISYFDQTSFTVKYATNASGTWVITSIATGRFGSAVPIAIDSNNKIHISFAGPENGNHNDLLYATNASGAWVISTVDAGAAVFYDLGAMAKDSNDKLHISYYDVINTNLKYATNVSGVWQTSTIDSIGDVGFTSSIAVDSNNKVHISYNDGSKLDLKYATNVDGVWVASTVDTVGNVGFYSSIVLDSGNNVHISYWDGSNEDLKYATSK